MFCSSELTSTVLTIGETALVSNSDSCTTLTVILLEGTITFEVRLCRTMPNARLPYRWRRPVLDAILESDPERQLAKIIAAERAISESLRQKPSDPAEQLALQEALCALKVLRCAD